MRVASAWLVVTCCLLFGCATEREGESTGESETEASALVAAESIEASNDLGAQAATQEAAQAAQSKLGDVGAQLTCTSHCNCQIGYTCESGTCELIWHPGPHPPTPWCMADCQCGARKYCDGGGAAGLCLAPTCSVAWSISTTPPGATSDFIVSSTDMPADGYMRIYGTRNGVTDSTGSQFPFIYGTFPITNVPGLAGVYVRYVQLYTAAGKLLCTSNRATVTFQ